MNSLTAIAGHEGDEEEWEKEIGGYVVPEEASYNEPVHNALLHQTNKISLSSKQ
jgi:hypothetical protein